jgi:hypothetical protein
MERIYDTLGPRQGGQSAQHRPLGSPPTSFCPETPGQRNALPLYRSAVLPFCLGTCLSSCTILQCSCKPRCSSRCHSRRTSVE